MELKGNFFEGMNVSECFETFEDIFSGSDFRLERIVSTGQVTADGEWYDQEQSEWVLLLKGEARIEIDGRGELTLSEGDHLLLPPHLRHRVSYTKVGVETVWLAIHYHQKQI